MEGMLRNTECKLKPFNSITDGRRIDLHVRHKSEEYGTRNTDKFIE